MVGRKQAANRGALSLGIAAFSAVLAAVPFMTGALYLTQHEGDTLHLADMVLRMAEAGQLPHLDFMTPIGIGALWPIALFAKLGLGMGHAIFAAQALLAALLLGPVLRAAQSRFPGGWAWLYAGYVMVLCLALVHGDTRASISVSMHYNRWAWALAYVALPLAMLEPLSGQRRPLLDGLLIGLTMAALVLLKVTYFAAFAPAVTVALLVRRDFAALLWAILAGAAVAGLATVLLGPEFWLAYMQDLATVAHSESRSAPGEPLADVLAAPRFMAGSLLLLGGVVFLRQAGAMAEGTALLFLMPAFIYVTYQNFGNDPQWLVFLGLLAFTLRPEGSLRNGLGWGLRDVLFAIGVGAFTLGLGSALNLAWSPLRHLFGKAEETVPLLAYRPQDDDIRIIGSRMYDVTFTLAGGGAASPYAAYAAKMTDKKPVPPAVLNGETLPECEMETGYNAWFEEASKELQAAGHAGSSIFVTDLFSAVWLFGPFEPLRGAAPWYYGGVPGLAAADHVLVPLCPTGITRRSEILQAIADQGWRLEEESRNKIYILLRPVKG